MTHCCASSTQVLLGDPMCKPDVFTDHCPFPENPFRGRIEIEQLPEYILSMKQLKKNMIPILRS